MSKGLGTKGPPAPAKPGIRANQGAKLQAAYELYRAERAARGQIPLGFEDWKVMQGVRDD